MHEAGKTITRRLGLALLLALAAQSAAAQVPAETPAALRDTLATDTTRAAPRLPALLAPRALPGALLIAPPGDTLLAASMVLGMPEMLGAQPGAFVYGFGAAGWPDGVSRFGSAPHREALRYGAVAGGTGLDDAFTGRPRYDLLPLTLLAPMRDDGGVLRAAPRALGGSVPVTEARYQTSSDGLQSVGAFHAQERGAGWLGALLGERRARASRVGYLFFYGGQAANGAYPGSRLAQARQTLFRVRLRAPGATLTLQNLHNRRSIGAHGGVVPFSSDYASIFFTLGASVRNASASRRTQRNDFEARARVRTRWFAAPSEAAFTWTRHELRYATGAANATLRARADRIALRASQPLAARRFGGIALRPEVRGEVGFANALGVNGGQEALRAAAAASRSDADLGVRAEWSASAWRGSAAAGARYDGFHVHPAFALSARLGEAARFAPFAETSFAPASVPWAFAQGWGGTLAPLAEIPASRILLARAGASVKGSAWTTSASVFARITSRPFDLFAEEAALSGNAIADTSAALALGEATRYAGGTLSASFRQSARRGVYASGSVTAQRLLGAPTALRSTLGVRLRDALPAAHASARLGFRAILFRRDLILDAAITARAWTRFRGRVYHPPTGLLAVAPESGVAMGPSGVLSGEVRMQVRVATLFVVYDNWLAQTEVQAGALLVPDYPLSPQHLRFGVYWPIDESE